MDTEEVDTTSILKRKKIERGQQLVHVKKGHAKGQMKKKNLEKEQQQEDPKTAELQI